MWAISLNIINCDIYYYKVLMYSKISKTLFRDSRASYRSRHQISIIYEILSDFVIVNITIYYIK